MTSMTSIADAIRKAGEVKTPYMVKSQLLDTSPVGITMNRQEAAQLITLLGTFLERPTSKLWITNEDRKIALSLWDVVK